MELKESQQALEDKVSPLFAQLSPSIPIIKKAIS
jgi:hypothetical protein